MAVLVIPEHLKAYMPENIVPERFWIHHDAQSDSLVVYSAGEPVPTVWDPIDADISIGLSFRLAYLMTNLS